METKRCTKADMVKQNTGNSGDEEKRREEKLNSERNAVACTCNCNCACTENARGADGFHGSRRAARSEGVSSRRAGWRAAWSLMPSRALACEICSVGEY